MTDDVKACHFYEETAIQRGGDKQHNEKKGGLRPVVENYIAM